jgi:rRNA-processing protein FCF1
MITQKIRHQLKDITDSLSKLINEIPIKTMEDVPGIAIIAPDHYFGKLSPEQKNVQLKLKRKYETLSELLKLTFRNAPDGVAQKLDEADETFRAWLELEPSWSLSTNRSSNDETLKKASGKIESLIDILEVDRNGQVIIIPDTNSLLISSEPKSYEAISGAKTFVFLLLPTVLAELDSLKILHRNPEVREKAQKVIKRVKGWRNQGSLTEGVTVNKTITVMAEYINPDMTNTLSWLDGNNSDDRIVASVLSIQAAFPSSKIVLATGDINLQNKADSAMIEVGELE